MRISLIIPTIWRSTLGQAVASAQESVGTEDEIIVIGDGPGECMVPGPHLVTIAALRERVGDYGCSACDYGMKCASGDFVFFIGDDDLVASRAFDIIREAVTKEPNLPHLFAMQHGARILQGSTECGNVSGQQIVVPRDMARMPKMAAFGPGEATISDWRFIKNVEEAWGTLVKHSEVIAILPKLNQGRIL